MKDISYIFRMNWLKVPDFLYITLLFGGWIILTASTGMIILGIMRKKEKTYFRGWSIALLIALVRLY